MCDVIKVQVCVRLTSYSDQSSFARGMVSCFPRGLPRVDSAWILSRVELRPVLRAKRGRPEILQAKVEYAS